MKQTLNFLLYSFILFLLFLLLTIFGDFIKNKIIFRKEEKEKKVPYESGVPSKGSINIRIDIKYFKIALLFLLFDVEAVYLLPWAIRIEKIGIFGLIEGLIFILILLFSYFYILKEREI
jgi:NADH-quinone oxidoreductase subunit A